MGKSIGTGYRSWAQLEADPDLVDAPIRPLVEALNATDWARTVFSCAGHPEEPDSVKRGRRQAHIDLLVNDLPQWQRFIRSIPGVPAVKVTEGSLGALPPWLREVKWLGVHGSAASPGGSRAAPWMYRRIVFEPAPYDLPSPQCRQLLDTALAAATAALRSLDPRISRADTH